jgi:Tol biopolymer transport system component
LSTGFRNLWGQFSPDGRRIAYQSDESQRFEIYVSPFPGSSRKSLVSTSGGVYPRWSPDGRELYYFDPDGTLMAVSIAVTGDSLDVGKPVALFQPRIVGGGASQSGYRQQYDVAPNGRFLINVALDSVPEPIRLILNWDPSRKAN